MRLTDRCKRGCQPNIAWTHLSAAPQEGAQAAQAEQPAQAEQAAQAVRAYVLHTHLPAALHVEDAQAAQAGEHAQTLVRDVAAVGEIELLQAHQRLGESGDQPKRQGGPGMWVEGGLSRR